MRGFRIAALAAVSVFGFATIAQAADMPIKAVRAPNAAPVVAPIYNWTGIYVGGLVGYGSGKSTHCQNPFSCFPGDPEADPKGWNGGVTVGYNWQMANWVLGFEGDWSWANMKGSSPGTASFGCGVGGTCDTKIKSFETARVRVGYAFDRFLPYVTAGVAWTQLQASMGNPVSSGSTTKSSFVGGGGLEYAFWQNLSVKVEYLYIAKLDDFTYDTLGACIGGVGGRCFVHVGATNEVRLGLNYRFTGL